MSEAEVYAALNTIFCDVFLREDIALKPEFTADDVPGWDSFRQIEILIAIQDKYGIKFRARELDEFRNVGDLARAITAKIGA